MKAVVVSVLLLCVVAAMGVRAVDTESDAEAEVVSQSELDASHENMVSTLEEYADKAHQLRDEIISVEHSLMEQMASIDTCPAGELSGLMARAKKQITHLFQIKSLYLAIKQQEAQLRELVNAGTGKRVPQIAPKKPAPAAPKPAAAKPAAKPAASSAAVKPADMSSLTAMNAKLHNALARLEGVTARLAKVEERSSREKKATLLIAGQMEKDEKRLNLHARVLRRLRSGAKEIKRSLAALARSCARSRRAESKLAKRPARRSGRRSRRSVSRRRGGRRSRRGGRRITPLRSRKSRKATRAMRRAWAKHAFSHPACMKRCARVSAKYRAKCAAVCDTRAKRFAKYRQHAAAKKASKSRRSRSRRPASRRSRKASRRVVRSKALQTCLNGCRKSFPSGKRSAAKKCALRCFRRHSHRAQPSRAVLRACSRQCNRIRSAKKGQNVRALRAACRRKCYRANSKSLKPKKAKKSKKAAKNQALKKCFKTCRKGKKWDRKCVKKCRTKYSVSAKKSAKADAKKLKACFKTCKVKGKWDRKCVRSCRKRFGAKKSKAVKKVNKALKACYKTCRGKSRVVTRGKGKKARRITIKGKWNMKCVRRCQKKFGKSKKVKAPKSAAYKACLKRCQPGKKYKKCAKACAKHNKTIKIKVISPSAKAVAAAIKGLKKKDKKRGVKRPETWEDVVRDSRRLLKKTVRLRDLVHKQVGRYMDTKDVEGRKYNGWWSIWDVLKGVKPGKHYTGRAKQIASDVKQIMQPALNAAADGPYGEVVNVLKGADEAFSSKYTKELGSPALDLTVDPKFDKYVEKPLPGARVKTVPYNPKRPYSPGQHTWKKTPPLTRLPELADEKYDSNNLTPVYAHQFKVKPRVSPSAEQPFDLKTKNWDYPQIPYSYPVSVVKHNPKLNNPHVRPPTPGFHKEWPEFRFQQTADSSEAAAQPMAAPEEAAAPEKQEAPMTEGTSALDA